MISPRFGPLLVSTHRLVLNSSRQTHWKFTRKLVPPLQEPKESPYIVGPHLKPDYVPVEYITDAIQHRVDNDLEHFLFEPRVVEYDEERTVKLLLIDDVEGLGITGQVVDAPYRFGASRLVAMRKAEYATDFVLSWYKFGERTSQSASSAISPKTVRLLGTRIYALPITQNVEVKPWHISLALRLSGCICPIHAIDQGSIEKIENEDGSPLVKCKVRINNHEQVEVKLTYEKLE